MKMIIKIGLIGLLSISSLFGYSGYYAPFEGTKTITQGWSAGYSHGIADGRNSKLKKGKGYAFALDIAGSNFNVLATKDGTIVSADWHYGFGNTIVIKHNDGLYSLYAHLSKIEKKSGTVKRGNLLGKSGNTGSWSEGAHLHFQVNTVITKNVNQSYTRKVNFQGFSITDVDKVGAIGKSIKSVTSLVEQVLL